MPVCFRVILCVMAVLPLSGRQSAAQPVQSSAKTSASQKQLTVDDIVAMAGAGLSDTVILAKLREADKTFDLTPAELIRLNKAKVSDAVISTMLDPKGAAAKSSSPQRNAQPMMPSTPMSVNRSGATPTPEASGGDVNDPMTPHDSGIYLYTKDHEGKPQMVVLERAAYQGSKTGGMLTSAMTYGIKKAKTKAVIPGPHAGIHVGEASPVFYFYFEDKQAGLGKTYFGVGNLSNPNQFVLLRLQVTKSNRETVIGQFSALGMSSGSDTNAMVAFKSERIRAGLYKVTVSDMKPGEYCFLASSGTMPTGMMAAYGGVTTGTDIFDFSVSVE